MRMNRLHVLCAALVSAAVLACCATSATAQQVDNLNISFNGPSSQFTYMQEFWTATISYYQNVLGRSSMPGNRHCHVYLSWDVGNQPVGSGPSGTEGSRSWFEAFLAAGNNTCDRVLVTFKNIEGVTVQSPNGYPTVSTYQTAVAAFLNTDWSYAGWSKGQTAFDYTAWNEPNLSSGPGNGYTNGTNIPSERAADYYLVLRKACTASNCGQVAAEDFGSNGAAADFIQECSNDLDATLCANASYIDGYKHAIAFDETTYGLASGFRPEVVSYHGWNDINNYINNSDKCTNPSTCVIKSFTSAMSGDTWTGSSFWDTEVGAGQNPQSNPGTGLQACAAAWLLNLTANTTSRFTRIYYTRAYDSTGEYWSLYQSNGTQKPSFTVLADRETTYTGQSCP